MSIKLDFDDCLRDSPSFRRQLSKAEDDLETFETTVKKIYENCHHFYHDGTKFLESYRRMIDSFQLLNTAISERDEEFTKKKVTKYCDLMADLRRSEMSELYEIHKSTSDKIIKLLDTEFKQLKDNKKQFEKLSHDLEQAYQKHADAPKSKQNQCDEAEKHLWGIKKSFGHSALDYINQINKLYIIRSQSILDLIQSCSQSYKSHFQYGYDQLDDYKVEFSDVSSKIHEMSQKSKEIIEKLDLKYDKIRENMNNKELFSEDFMLNTQQMNNSPALPLNTTTNNNKSNSITSQNGANNVTNSTCNVQVCGYLFKRSHNTFKKWNRRWFILNNGRLLYQKKNESEYCIMESNLILCKVREVNDIDRRFTFEIVSPKCRHMLQADSQRECNYWVESLTNAIKEALNNNLHNPEEHTIAEIDESNQSSNSSTNEIVIVASSNDNDLSTFTSAGDNDSNNSPTPTLSQNASFSNRPPAKVNKQMTNRKKFGEKRNILNGLNKLPGNDKCADCSASNPVWVSINLCVLLCIECSGKHRGLGVHISKVRSITLDDIDRDTETLLLSLSNSLLNGIYEATYVVSNDLQNRPNVETLRATPTSDNMIRENWIKMKYLDKTFVKPLPKDIKMLLSHFKNKNCIEYFLNDDKIIHDDNNDADKDRDYFNRYAIINNSDNLLHYAAEYANLPLISYALALDADRNSIDESNDNYTPLMKAVLSGCVEAVELLILNGGRIDALDAKGRTCLHHATIIKNLKIVCLLLKRGADPSTCDIDQIDPIAIAMQDPEPNIVTILRVAKMNNDLRKQDSNWIPDPLFEDTMKDLLAGPATTSDTPKQEQQEQEQQQQQQQQQQENNSILNDEQQ